MAWNFFNFIPNGPHDDQRFPVTTGDKVGVEQAAQDTHPLSIDCNTVVVARYNAASQTWARVFASHNNKNSLLITDSRIVVVFAKPPVKRSVISVIALAQAAGQHGQHKGETFAGHLPYKYLKSIAARGGSPGFPAIHGSLRFIAEDDTDNSGGTPVYVEVTPVGKAKTPPFADDIYRRALAVRQNHAAFANADLSSDIATAATVMTHERKDYGIKNFSTFVPVRGKQ